MTTLIRHGAIRWVSLAGLIVASGACRQSGDALLVVSVTSSTPLPDVLRLEVTVSTVTDGGPKATLIYPSLDGGAVVISDTPVTFGVALPGNTGEVTVAVQVYGAEPTLLASGISQLVTPRAGARTDVNILLGQGANGDGGDAPSATSGAAGAMGAAGAGGAAGTAGVTGAAGSSGAGGSGGGGMTGNAGHGGGSGGSGGMAGGGQGGGGGGSAGGTAGAGGTGGMTATCQGNVCATGLVCERLAPATCADPSWAEWPMPNGPVDVAAGAPNTTSYTDNGDGTVTDTVTGLMWQKVVPTGTFAQPEAVAFCQTLNLAGHNDWRLPSRIELLSIVDYGRANPSIDATLFGTPQAVYWSSSPAADSPSDGWFVAFTDGSADRNLTTTPFNARCVR